MKLSLSTAAAPGGEFDTFDEACRARGLEGIELVIGPGDDVPTLAARLAAARVRVVALRVETLDGIPLADLARLSGALSLPLSLPLGIVAGISLTDLARTFTEAGGTLLLGFATDLDQVLAVTTALRETNAPPDVGLAWELRPSSEDLGVSGAVLLTARERLGLVRLYGGGPEQRDQDGRGVGPLFVDLALSGYGGPIVLAPSRPEELPRWHKWLTSKNVVGCGSARATGEMELDVRDVEPKDRLGTILGAFRVLPRGATLHITLDHDPSCMYYALDESEPPGTFDFRKIGDGPEVWHAEVKRL